MQLKLKAQNSKLKATTQISKPSQTWSKVLKFLVIVLTFDICVLSLTTSVSASEDIGYSKIHPASPLYFLKTIRENLELKFAGSVRVKMLRQMEFATRRLREAKTLISVNQDLIPPTLERYSSSLNSLPKEILEKDVSNHLEVLQQMHKSSSSLSKMAIRSAMNKIINRADVPAAAKLTVCKFFLKEASSSALNQTEQVVLKDRAQSCLSPLISSIFL